MSLHPLDVYQTALNDHEHVEDALGTVVHYLEDLATENEVLPWGKWFTREDRDDLQELCQRALQQFYHTDELRQFWPSISYWSKAALFEEPTLSMMLRNGCDMPECTWHALVSNHGVSTTLELLAEVDAIPRTEAFLDKILTTPGPLLALPLLTGMFEDNSLAKPYGLHGHTLDFWARWVGRGSEAPSRDLFCARYPWLGPQLIHEMIATRQSSNDRSHSMQAWAQAYPLQSQALHGFMYSSKSGHLGSFIKTVNAEESLVQERQRLLDGLYPPTEKMAIYIEQYRSLFDGAQPTMVLHLPELNLD